MECYHRSLIQQGARNPNVILFHCEEQEVTGYPSVHGYPPLATNID